MKGGAWELFETSRGAFGVPMALEIAPSSISCSWFSMETSLT